MNYLWGLLGAPELIELRPDQNSVSDGLFGPNTTDDPAKGATSIALDRSRPWTLQQG
jgi:hypothetical protein